MIKATANIGNFTVFNETIFMSWITLCSLRQSHNVYRKTCNINVLSGYKDSNDGQGWGVLRAK